MIAKFPSKCCICEEQFIPGESEIEQHPTMRGPKGGKKFMHVECAGGEHEHAHSHSEQLPPPPDEIFVPGMANPFRNAGRRTHKGRQKSDRLARMSPSDTCDLSGMSKAQLVAQGDAAAMKELARRGRGSDGVKLAWTEKKKSKSNPFGYGYEF